MRGLTYINLRQQPERIEQSAEWFYENWKVPKETYLEWMGDYLSGKTEYGWYLCMDGDKIAGGLGVIENDFHKRKDLAPNITCVYVEPNYRRQGIVSRLLDMAVEELRSKGISPVYLITADGEFYESLGWEFQCIVEGDEECEIAKLYMHR